MIPTYQDHVFVWYPEGTDLPTTTTGANAEKRNNRSTARNTKPVKDQIYGLTKVRRCILEKYTLLP
jgi:hypothetical protein